MIVLSLLRGDDDPAIGLLPLGMGGDAPKALERGVDDPALIGIHGLHGEGTAGFGHLQGVAAGETAEGVLPAGPIALGIDGDALIAVLLPILVLLWDGRSP